MCACYSSVLYFHSTDVLRLKNLPTSGPDKIQRCEKPTSLHVKRLRLSSLETMYECTAVRPQAGLALEPTVPLYRPPGAGGGQALAVYTALLSEIRLKVHPHPPPSHVLAFFDFFVVVPAACRGKAHGLQSAAGCGTVVSADISVGLAIASHGKPSGNIHGENHGTVDPWQDPRQDPRQEQRILLTK